MAMYRGKSSRPMKAETAQALGEELRSWLDAGKWDDVRSLSKLAREFEGPIHEFHDYLGWDMEAQANAWVLASTRRLLTSLEVLEGDRWVGAFPIFPQPEEFDAEVEEFATSLRQVVKLPEEVTEEDVWAKAGEDLKHILGRMVRWAEYAEVVPALGELCKLMEKFAKKFEGLRPAVQELEPKAE